MLSAGALFKDDIMEESICNLADRNGARVDSSWFGSSRKKDMVVVSTLFSIVAKAVRRNKDVDKVMCSVEFKSIRDLKNALSIEQLAGGNQFPAKVPVPETPPSSPEYLLKTPEHPLSQNIEEARLKKTFEVMQEVDKSTGPRLKVKRAEAVAKNCLDVLKDGQYVIIKSEYIRI